MDTLQKNDSIDARLKALEILFKECSPYLTSLYACEYEILKRAVSEGYDETFAALLKEAFKRLYFSEDKESVFKGLRRLKRQAALIAASADIENIWDLTHLTRSLSVLAELCVRIAVSFVLRQAAKKGEFQIKDPHYPEKDSGFFILAMGKLGGRELNYSSDIDLIALFDGNKAPYIGRKDVGTFFIRVTKEMISLLDERTEDGYVFRVDMRLRPDPGSTPVAVSSAAAECYYESFAQNWERAAFIKARVIAGDKDAGTEFLKDIRPFIWRRTSDFYVLEQIRSLKYSFSSGRREDFCLKGHNVKLGQGGIREIEFFTQLQQLLWGGRDAKLRLRSTLNALCALEKSGWVSCEHYTALKEAYLFLRKVEHRLQMVSDEQTQTLPADDDAFSRLAKFCGFEDVKTFEESLLKQMRRVQEIYETLFQNETEDAEDIWAFGGTELPDETRKKLEELGFKKTEYISDCVRGWLSGRYRAFRSDRARALMEGLLPLVFKSLSKTGDGDAAFIRFDDFLKGLPSGIQLFSLFQSRPALLDLTAEVISSSPFLATWLTRFPDLFDTVLSQDFFEPFPELEKLKEEIAEQTAFAEDFDKTLELLNRFVREKKFRCGVRFLQGMDDGHAVGKNLANLAEAALSILCPAVRGEFEKRFGKIDGSSFSFVVMGKAGSGEMNFRSDLDILFLYDAPEGSVSCAGTTSLSAGTYFARLGQRFVSALSSDTAQGALWAADMRLRPSGNAGPAAVSASAFKKYYENDAWTWEKMALCKAKAAWGDVKNATKDIKDVLTRINDEEKLKTDVTDMYNRVTEAHASKSPWDVKYAKGGMVEIEFGVQYLQLKFGHEHPDLLLRNVEDVLNKASALSLIPEKTRDVLLSAYRLWQDLSVLFSLCYAQDGTPGEDTAGADAKLCKFCGAKDLDGALQKIRETLETATLHRLF